MSGVETGFPSLQHPEDVAVKARRCLQCCAFRDVQGVSCECDEGTLFLTGRLTSFYHKQIAQEAVARLPGVIKVVNQTEVKPR